MLSTKPLPRSLLRRADLRAKQRYDESIKAQVRARDKHKCRVCGRKPVDVHEEKRRGAGGSISLVNSYAADRACHDLLQYRHMYAEMADGSDKFDANKPLRFVTSQKVADLLWANGQVPSHVHVVPGGR